MGLTFGRLGRRPDPLDSVWPSQVRIDANMVQVGEHYARSYTVVAYPREVQAGWFEPIIGFSSPITVVLSTEPVDLEAVVKSMNRRIVWHKGTQAADRVQGRLSRADQEIALQDAESVRMGIARGDTRMLQVGLTITVWAKCSEELDQMSRLLESKAQGMMLALRPLRYQQQLGLKRVLPLDEPNDKVREMDSRAWSTLFPFSSGDVVHPHGQMLGINPKSRSLVIVDRFQMASPHSITIGWSGAGKSFSAKLEALRSRYRNLGVTVVDPEGEYRSLTNAGATIWTIGDRDARAPFPYNPFCIDAGLSPEEVERQCDFLLRLLRTLSPDLMHDDGGHIYDSVFRTAHQRSDRFSLKHVAMLEMPQLLENLAKESHRASARLEMVWERWKGAMGDESGPRTDDSFEVYDLSRLSEGMKSSVYLALTEWIIRRMGKEPGKRLIIFDEAWHLLTDDHTAPYLEELFRRARKWGTALSLLSQDIGDFTRSRAAEVCLRNSPMVLLLRQHPESLQEVAALMRLHEGEVETIASASPGEGLLVLAEDHVPIRVIASKQETSMLTQPLRSIDSEPNE